MSFPSLMDRHTVKNILRETILDIYLQDIAVQSTLWGSVTINYLLFPACMNFIQNYYSGRGCEEPWIFIFSKKNYFFGDIG